MKIERIGAVLVLLSLVGGCRVLEPARIEQGAWDDFGEWTTNSDGESAVLLETTFEAGSPLLRVTYFLRPGFGFVELMHPMDEVPDEQPIVLRVRAEGEGMLELKMIDADGSVFGRKLPVAEVGGEWTNLVVYLRNTDYWWGGDDEFGTAQRFALALAGQGAGTFEIARSGPGAAGTPPSFPSAGPLLDPDRDLEGIGFRQRRSADLIPPDPLALAWLEAVQDTSSPQQALLGSMEDGALQTFNNALAAIAFLVADRPERAERILDTFAGAMDRGNTDPRRQNFYYRGEARGFFQNAVCVDGAYMADGANDRWMGDMAWLLIACKFHERQRDPLRYREMTQALRDLLVSWYVADPAGGGFVRHGWRRGDSRLHEEGGGHPEGNIDCYAAFRLCGDDDLAGNIRRWMDRTVSGKGLPLDLYSWRALAFGGEACDLLDIPDHDLRYRKTLTVAGRPAMGVFHGAEADISNIWLDGVGHMACAYFACGDIERGNFYANQLDAFLLDRTIGGVAVKGLPYTANRDGGYEWVDPGRGFTSVAAWYLFAKNRFNPFTLTWAETEDEASGADEAGAR